LGGRLRLGEKEMKVDLSLTSNREYRAGRRFSVRALWLVVEALVFANPIVTSYGVKRVVLRVFGARVSRSVIIKPGVRVKYPWRLRLGANCWIGERAWIDNMEDVWIGDNVVISQGAYICTGNHDWSDPGMGLTPQPVTIEDGAWVGAFARVAPGRRIGEESILVLGAVALEDTEPLGIYAGNPASLIRYRTIRDRPGPALKAEMAGVE
jgi:putative colanic acid biosynthesis acetyltransferase WcaF